MSLTRNCYEGDVAILDLKPGDKIVLDGSSNVYKIKNSKLAHSDKIFLTFEDGEKAGYCSDGEVSCANKLKYFHNIAKTIRGDTTVPDMTWEELVEKAKELGYELNNDRVHDYLKKDDVMFYSNGSISAVYMECAWHSDICCFATDRTPSQMYQIMLALED